MFPSIDTSPLSVLAILVSGFLCDGGRGGGGAVTFYCCDCKVTTDTQVTHTGQASISVMDMRTSILVAQCQMSKNTNRKKWRLAVSTGILKNVLAPIWYTGRQILAIHCFYPRCDPQLTVRMRTSYEEHAGGCAPDGVKLLPFVICCRWKLKTPVFSFVLSLSLLSFTLGSKLNVTSFKRAGRCFCYLAIMLQLYHVLIYFPVFPRAYCLQSKYQHSSSL